jgi:hypothetical protein
MRNLKKHQSLEEQMHFVCDKCYYQFASSRPTQAEKLTSQIESIKRLYDDNIISEETYHHLLKVLISMYIGNQVTTTISYRLSSILRDRLSPHRILESLALAP